MLEMQDKGSETDTLIRAAIDKMPKFSEDI